MNWLNSVVRPEIIRLKAYSSARNEYSGLNQVQLDANEIPWATYGVEEPLNRYPEPQPQKLKQKLAEMYGVDEQQLLVTRGMDEGIDLLIKIFCIPYKDAIAIAPPTFGYYAVSANISGIKVVEAPVDQKFSPDWEYLKKIRNTKIIFLCTPNNPTGCLISLKNIEELCEAQKNTTIIAIDEAYIEFSDAISAMTLLEKCQNLIVMRTLSKAYALAGARIGTVIAHADIIALLRKIIPPYPIATPCAAIALNALSPTGLFFTQSKIAQIKEQRDYLYNALVKSSKIAKVYASAANFLLIIAKDADALYSELKSKGIIVRSRKHDIPSAIRITVGTQDENNLLLAALGLLTFENQTIPRTGSQTRKTLETEIFCEVVLDSKGSFNISTGIGFFDHMLEQLAKHSGISILIKATGDTHIDTHHTVEDVAIVLGQALKKALGNKKGIGRYGFLLPMDEAEAKVSLDLSGRGNCQFSANFSNSMLGEFQTEMVEHFFASFSDNLGAALHIYVTGKNTHHMVEAIFKCTAKVLGQAVAIKDDKLPSTKGVL